MNLYHKGKDTEIVCVPVRLDGQLSLREKIECQGRMPLVRVTY